MRLDLSETEDICNGRRFVPAQDNGSRGPAWSKDPWLEFRGLRVADVSCVHSLSN